jgi:hypothetical protein
MDIKYVGIPNGRKIDQMTVKVILQDPKKFTLIWDFWQP